MENNYQQVLRIMLITFGIYPICIHEPAYSIDVFNIRTNVDNHPFYINVTLC